MGMIILGIYLILVGLSKFIPMGEPVGTILAVLAIVAGILVLVGR